MLGIIARIVVQFCGNLPGTPAFFTIIMGKLLHFYRIALLAYLLYADLQSFRELYSILQYVVDEEDVSCNSKTSLPMNDDHAGWLTRRFVFYLILLNPRY